MKQKLIQNQEPFSYSSGMLNVVRNAKTGNLFKKFNRKILLVLFFLTFTLVGFSQSNFTFGVSGGYDKTFNHLTGLGLLDTKDAFPDFNLGVDGMFNVGEKIRIRAELGYENLSYTKNWNSESTDPTRIYKSVVSVSNLDISPRVDYKLAKSGSFDLYASAGFRFEFTLGNYERTTLANGDKLTTNLIINTNTKTNFTQTQAGAVGGFILKYNVNPSFGITLAPDYTYFFDYYYTQNVDKMQRIRVNLGVEWKF